MSVFTQSNNSLGTMTQQEVIDSLPDHLQAFAAFQDYELYTARDHAVWRFLLHQLNINLRDSAHSTYFEGLSKTGIGLEEIPRIEHINACLNNIGWRAVVVDGFLPPAIFMEFQALKVLVIAVNMRSFEHMLYTPAPDIVHESAGHAPFIIDIDYAEFLQRFGELGMKAIANDGDMAVYEAIRNLSIVKETPGASERDISLAEQNLKTSTENNSVPSESALLARLHWWTVEYGLVGEVSDYRIYGAGLLSSLGESQQCLNDDLVSKQALTIDSINTGYDITAAQPQLFVTESCRHLSQVLNVFGREMCFLRGGSSALQQAIEAKTVNTAVTNSGIQISGMFSKAMLDAVGNTIYYNTSGGTQLAYQDQELTGHGTKYHAAGFGSPLGRLRGLERCLSDYTVDELKRHQIEIGKQVKLQYLSGIEVSGTLEGLIRKDQKNIVMTFTNCTVSDSQNNILFDPNWGNFDMAIGDSIVSVYGGTADISKYPLYQAPSNTAAATIEYDEKMKAVFADYAKVRQYRENSSDNSEIEELAESILKQSSADWLLIYEALELLTVNGCSKSIQQHLIDQLKNIHSSADAEVSTLIEYALNRIVLE